MRRLLGVVSLLVAVVISLSAAPTGKIKVVGVPDKFKSKNAGWKTTSLKNVGVGERVVLKAWAVSGTETPNRDSLLTVTGATWEFASRPFGSASVIADTGSTGQIFVYFVPDVTGSYEVRLTATTAEMGVLAPVTVKITAGTYKGVGIYNAATAGYDNFNCLGCHSAAGGEFAEFVKTNHASVMPRRMNDAAGHFGNNCLPCHTVGAMGTPPANNNNFEKVRTTLGWSVPHNNPNTYEDSLVTPYPNLAILSGIQCENCHGPAAQHYGPGVNIDKSLSAEVCGPCHFSSDRHPKGYSWDASGHAVSYDEGKVWNYMNRSGCSQCHTGNGFVEAYNNIPTATTGTYAEPQGVTCAACHDPHNNTNIFQLRRNSVGEACTGCHETRLSSRGMHHSVQGPMVKGTEATAYAGTPTSGIGEWAGWEFPGYAYDNGTHSEIEDRCAECHMARTPTYDPTYAKPDTLLNRLGGHTFAIVWDHDTPDNEEDDILNYVGCQECHGVVTLDFVRLTQAKTHALLDSLDALLPDTTGGVPKWITAPGLTTAQKAGAYNYYFVSYDGSYGAHNFKYAEGLLRSSIEQLKLGAGSAEILAVKDVPNDQGRQVFVMWNKFPAEGFSYDRLASYGVWRKDPFGPNAPALKSVKTLGEVISAGPVGTQVTVAGDIWTYVANVPASKLAQYSVVVPTLADSTPLGTANTTFYVAGYTSDLRALYASAPATGHSIDNIRPTTPTGLAAADAPDGVRLSWDKSADPDVEQYIVYRGTSPNPTNELATVKGFEYLDNAVVYNVTYFYRIVAVDFAGNRSDYSASAGVLVTDVKAEDGVPAEFALKQNFPNPFNPSTEIAFSVPKAVHVTLSVYTISGELVTTLLDNEMAAGNYRVTWNGKTSGGRDVSTGLYLYRIHAGDYTAVKKMVMVK